MRANEANEQIKRAARETASERETVWRSLELLREETTRALEILSGGGVPENPARERALDLERALTALETSERLAQRADVIGATISE